MTAWSLAIDLGTSNTAAAACPVGRPDRARPVKLSSASTEMPSGVLVHRDGHLLAGEVARNGAGTHPPDAYERTPKRRLGEGGVLLGGRPVSDVELVAVVLRAAVERAARQHDGVPPSELRLTHPAVWAGARLDALVAGAAEAGFPDPLLVPEPVAAARWYGVDHAERRSTGPIAVFDIGGGTLDVAVLEPDRDGQLLIRGVRGVDPLGGEVFDGQLLALVGEALVARGRGDLWARFDGSAAVGRRRTLLDEVRRAKHTLSDESVADIAVVADAESDLVSVTRREFEDRIRPLVSQGVNSARAALSEAGIGADDLTALYLVGGSSFVPLVADALASELGVVPATFDDPKTVTALGALHEGASSGEPRVAPARPAPVVQPAGDRPTYRSGLRVKDGTGWPTGMTLIGTNWTMEVAGEVCGRHESPQALFHRASDMAFDLGLRDQPLPTWEQDGLVGVDWARGSDRVVAWARADTAEDGYDGMGELFHASDVDPGDLGDGFTVVKTTRVPAAVVTAVVQGTGAPEPLDVFGAPPTAEGRADMWLEPVLPAAAAVGDEWVGFEVKASGAQFVSCQARRITPEGVGRLPAPTLGSDYESAPRTFAIAGWQGQSCRLKGRRTNYSVLLTRTTPSGQLFLRGRLQFSGLGRSQGAAEQLLGEALERVDFGVPL